MPSRRYHSRPDFMSLRDVADCEIFCRRMMQAALFAVVLALISCASPKPLPPVPVTTYDKAIRYDFYDRTPKPETTWYEHASATVAPLISPVASVIKMLVPVP